MNDPNKDPFIKKLQEEAEAAMVHHGQSELHGSETEPARQGREHRYAEAYCHMIYECDHVHQETIWNSRDGVTPFIIRCQTCGEEAKHSYWWRDRYDPLHQPVPGERIFAGMPEQPSIAVVQGDPSMMIDLDRNTMSVDGEVVATDVTVSDLKLRYEGSNRAQRRAERYSKNLAIEDRNWPRNPRAG